MMVALSLWFETGYVMILAGLAAYGCHRSWLVFESRRLRRRPPSAAVLPQESAQTPTSTTLSTAPGYSSPTVLIQIPLYNEGEAHVRRLLASAVAVEWPRTALEIQVLDDSDDGSEHATRALVERYRAAGLPLRVVRRRERGGYKAGALENGLHYSDAEFVAIFDADFAVPPDFLTRTIPLFGAQEVAMVQARWGHRNERQNLLTRIQAIMLDGHFSIEHKARSQAGRFFNFNGTAGVWRRAAIADAGGWRGDSITEDVDLSLRAWLRGWRFRYLDDLVALADLPENLPSYKIQQNRWVSGSIQTAVTYFGTILRSRLPVIAKLDLLFYLTGNLTYLLLFGLALMLVPTILLRLGANASPFLWLDLPLLLLAMLSMVLYCRVIRRGRDGFWSYYFWRVPGVMALGLGMTIHNGRAIVRGLAGHARVFERTPKGKNSGLREWRVPGRFAGGSALPLLEGSMALYVFGCAIVSLISGDFLALPFLALFLSGFGAVFLLSLPAKRRALPADIELGGREVQTALPAHLCAAGTIAERDSTS